MGSAPLVLPPGTPFLDTTIESCLGIGGMAMVYAVRRGNERLAMKVQHRHREGSTREVQREAKAQQRIVSPFVLRVLDVVEDPDDERVVLFLPLVEHGSLGDLLDRRALTMPEALALFHGIAQGVAAAHRVNVVHRDLKPSNVLLQLDDTGVTPLVADFGIAKALDATRFTSSNVEKGTVGYMAPEQRADAASVDLRADLFSLGMVLRELLSRLDPEPPDRSRWTSLVERLVQERPEDRLPSVDMLLSQLDVPPPDVLGPNSPLARDLAATVAARRARQRRVTQAATPEQASAGARRWRWPAVVALGPVALGVGLAFDRARRDLPCPDHDLQVGFADRDGDGVGGGRPVPYCRGASGYVTEGGDCDDQDGSVHLATTYFPDHDGDGRGGAGAPSVRCAAPGPGWASVAGDCDDTDPEVHVDAIEICNGKDDDCDRLVDDLATCTFTWNHRNPGTWLTNQNLCHGNVAAKTTTCGTTHHGQPVGGGLARLDTLPDGEVGFGVKILDGLQPSTRYYVDVAGKTDESDLAPNNRMLVELGDVRMVIDQAEGPRRHVLASGTVASDANGAIVLEVTATSGPDGQGHVSYHSSLSSVVGTTVPPNGAR